MATKHTTLITATLALAAALAGCPSDNNTNNLPASDMGAGQDMARTDMAPSDMGQPEDMGADMTTAQDMGADMATTQDMGVDMAAQEDMATMQDMGGASGTLRIATWNVSYLDLPGQGDRYQRTADDYALLGKYVDRLKADVVAVQEVRGAAGVGTIFSPADWDAACEDRNSAQNVCFVVRKASGWTLAKQPDVTAIQVGNTGLRAGLDIILTHPDHKPLRLLNVHLKTDCFVGNTAGGCGVFFQQITALEAWIDARVEAGEAFAVMGDFNRFMTTDDAAWLEIDDMMPAGADLTRAITTDDTPCWNHKFSNYIDHIILDPATTSWLKGADQLVFDETDFDAYYERLSDHCPVWADLQVPAP